MPSGGATNSSTQAADAEIELDQGALSSTQVEGDAHPRSAQRLEKQLDDPVREVSGHEPPPAHRGTRAAAGRA